MSETERMDALRDPENFEFMRSHGGEQIHIVATGLPPSMLMLGKQAAGDTSEDAEKALCGLESEFTPGGTPSAGQTELPQVDVDPDTSRKAVYDTGNVRVWDVADGPPAAFGASRSVVPSPDAADAGAPPG